MVQITRKTTADIPKTLLTEGARLTESMKAAYDNGERSFKIDPEVYGHKEVKDKLIDIQNGKCCFCEAKITHIDDGDIEHFRPKKGFRQSKNESLQRPGYYWLCYEWDNLFLACTKCNQRNKANLFPLMPSSPRAISHHTDIKEEKTVFIHPASENPESFISFYEEVSKGTDKEGRGAATIESLGLNRFELNEDRRVHVSDLKTMLEIIKLVPQTPAELREQVLGVLRKMVTEKTKETHEYAGMYRAFFKKYPIPEV